MEPIVPATVASPGLATSPIPICPTFVADQSEPTLPIPFPIMLIFSVKLGVAL